MDDEKKEPTLAEMIIKQVVGQEAFNKALLDLVGKQNEVQVKIVEAVIRVEEKLDKLLLRQPLRPQDQKHDSPYIR